MKPRAAVVPRILVVDDDPNHLAVLRGLLKLGGLHSLAAPDVDAALRIIDESALALVISDLVMPGKSGLDLLVAIRERRPALPVIVVSGHADIESAVAAMKRGAYDFITKPFDEDELLTVVRKALVESRMNADLLSGYFDAGHAVSPDVVGTSPAIEQLLLTVRRIGPTDSTVLISGETGVGKELIVKAVHAASPRRDHPLVKVNCAAIPEGLAESELFGFERGAFTGAVTGKPGRFELAHEGTLFLDEIGDMPYQLQSKLLCALQDKRFDRVGGTTPIEVDVRVVAATNRDLRADVQAGRFRADLFYRLNVVPLHVPALRERKEDIAPLLAAFLRKFALRHRKPVTRVLPEVTAAFLLHDWPGNIRELENAVERMVLLAEGDTIGPQLLPAELAAGTAPLCEATTLKEKRDGLVSASEKQLIMEALAQTNQNRTRAAKLLGVSRRTLQGKIRTYGL